MNGVRISQLPVLPNTSVVPSDSLPIVDSVSSETKQIPISQLDLRWQGVPNGGITNQVLAKASNTDKNVFWKTFNKSDVGLANVDNTSDANKPISSATLTALNLKANQSALSLKADISWVNTQLLNKQDKLPAGDDGEVLTLVAGIAQWAPSGSSSGVVTSVFGRSGPAIVAQIGDYDPTMVGLGNVDNTSDADKPISDLTQLALNAKQDSLPAGTNGFVLTLVGGIPTWNAAPTGLPSQATHAGKVLMTDGTNPFWGLGSSIVENTIQTLTSNANVTIQNVPIQSVRLESNSGNNWIATLPSPSLNNQLLYLTGNSDDNPVTILGVNLTSDKTLLFVNIGSAWKLLYGV